MTTPRTTYLSTAAFPRAAAAGAFGPGAAYESFRVDHGSAAADHFASDVVFGTVTVRHGDGAAAATTTEHPVVVKFKNADRRMCAMMNMNEKFRNEHAFYGRLLPELARGAPDPEAALALFPRFVYSDVRSDGDDDDAEQLIIVANAAADGYRPADSRLFLDADHALLALRRLGAMHGLSYAAKARPDGLRELQRLAAGLAETQWFDGHWYKSPRFLSGTAYRGVNALLAGAAGDGGTYAGRLGRMRAMLDGESRTMAELLRPVEPLAVLCHGDYCRNNLLFRYDAATGRPADAVMVDLAQARYASPAVDLSFFLFMNTSAADRAARWDDFVAAYVAGVAETAPPAGRPTAADVHAEMRRCGLYGYAHCSFFLPAMVHPEPPDVERLTTCTDDERIELINGTGGPEADRLLASIVALMVDRRYV